MLSLSDLPVNCNYVVLVLSNYPLYFYYILSMPVCAPVHMCMGIRGQQLAVSSLSPPRGSQGLHWAGGQHLYPLRHFVGS